MSLCCQLAAERACLRSRWRRGSLRGPPVEERHTGGGAAGAGRQVLAGRPGCGGGREAPVCSPETLGLGRLHVDEQGLLSQHFGVAG